MKPNEYIKIARKISFQAFSVDYTSEYLKWKMLFFEVLLATVKSGRDFVYVYSCTLHEKCNLLDEKMLLPIFSLLLAIYSSLVFIFVNKKMENTSQQLG